MLRWLVPVVLLLGGFDGAWCQRMPSLIPYNQYSLWGYSDTNGIVVIRPQWKNVYFFTGDRARVETFERSGNNYCLINRRGEYIIPPERHWSGYWSGFTNAQFNIVDSAGRMGMIDWNGCVRIPPIYKNEWGMFRYQKIWDKTVLLTTLDNKRGVIDTLNHIIIPFEYTKLLVLPEPDAYYPGSISFSYSGRPEPFYPSMSKYLIAEKDGKAGVIDYHDRIMVPFGKYQSLQPAPPCWYVVGMSGKVGVVDSLDHIVLPIVYSRLEPAGKDYFIATSTDSNRVHFGLLNTRLDTVLPFRYSQIRAVKDTIVVTLNDSVAPPNYPTYEPAATRDYYNQIRRQYNGHRLPRNLRSYRRWTQTILSIAPFGAYTRALNSHTLEPYSDWTFKDLSVIYTNQYAVCGSAANRDYWRDMEAARPAIVRAGKYFRDFDQDSISWRTNTFAGGALYGIIGHKMTKGYSDVNPYSAIVDTNLHYLAGPVNGATRLLYMNTKEHLIIASELVNGRMLYSVLDTLLVPRIANQPMAIREVFRWQGQLFALTGDGYYLRDRYSYVGVNTPVMGTVLDSAGNKLSALNKYKVQYFTDQSGSVSDGFCGYFFAIDTLGLQGIVAMDGSVVMPKLSFKSRTLSVIKEGMYLIEKNGGHCFVDGENREFVPGLTVYSIEPAHSDHYNGHSPYQDSVIPGVYLMKTIDSNHSCQRRCAKWI